MAPRPLFGFVSLATALVALLVGCTSAPPSAEDDLPTMPAPDRHQAGSDAPNEDPAPPTLAPTCEDTCSLEGERRCSADKASYEVCVRGANGCLGFAASACISGSKCDPVLIEQCAGKCSGEVCPQTDAKRCSGQTVERCQLDKGCLVWKTDQDCATTNEVCTGSSCEIACTSNCTTAGAKRCVSGTNAYEVCKQVQPGCLRWQGTTACGSGMVCSGGSCTCSNKCSTGSNSCVSPTQFETCVTNANGCRVWSAVKNCVRATPSPGCYAYPKACFGTCNDTCTTENAVGCTGPTSYVQCSRNSEQCLENVASTCKTSNICFSDPHQCAYGY